MPDKKNKRLHLGDEGYLEENPLRVFRSYTLGEAAARGLKDLGVGGAKAVGRGARKLRRLVEGEMDREDMSKALQGQRESAIARRAAGASAKAAKEKSARIANTRARAEEERRRTEMSGLRGGGKVKMGYKKGGSVKKSSKKSIDGLAQRGRTRGTMR